MPIIERDPWRMQFFENIVCPDDVFIPTDDEHAYELYPEYRWIYNKLLVCDTQGIAGAPHGVTPEHFPVFSKPIYNMHGMGVGGRVIASAEELALHITAGHMWMEMMQGKHVSTDVVLLGGEAQWWRHTVGVPLSEGLFDYWTIDDGDRPELESYCGDWLRRHLRGYSGAANIESIGGRIIEVHLRFADQWPDMYGRGWLEAIVELYARRRWRYPDDDRRIGYSVVLFGGHNIHYTKPPAEFVESLRARPGIHSVQITFHEDIAPELHAMPPGGFRLAVINCDDLEAGMKAREDLALSFWSAQNLGPWRKAAG
jgi:hypothetical protein